MRLVSYRKGRGPVQVGVVQGDRVLDVSGWVAARPLPAQALERHAEAGTLVPSGGMLRLLQAGPEAMGALASHVEATLASPARPGDPLADCTLYAPVPRPGKIIGVGRNYADHAKETGVSPFEKPRIIFKVPSSVVAPGAPVPRPAAVTKMDYEVELAVVIGRWGRDVPASQALSLVAGYTLLNDISAREFQFDVTPPQTTFAKSMDGFCPLGPWIVTPDEVPDPQALTLSCWLNGERVQHASTASMLFPVANLVAYMSGFMTLEPGDVIATGTPAGIGAFRKPPVYLQPGDRLRLEIDAIGAMEHSIT